MFCILAFSEHVLCQISNFVYKRVKRALNYFSTKFHEILTSDSVKVSTFPLTSPAVTIFRLTAHALHLTGFSIFLDPFHSRPQSPRSFWSAPRIETSGRDRSRKSANHGLPAFVRSLRNLNNNGYYRLQKWAAIALARYLAPARGLDPWCRPKGSWALGTRMDPFKQSQKGRVFH